jgi:hypothetical protein
VAHLKSRGLRDPDILHLLDLFKGQFPEVKRMYAKLAKRSRESPEAPPSVRMKDLGQFIKSVEDVVESELETLKNYIIKNNTRHASVLPLEEFYQYLTGWVEKVYNDRKAYRADKSPSPMPKKPK